MLKKGLMALSVVFTIGVAFSPALVQAAPAAPAHHQGGGPYFLMGNANPAAADQSVTSGPNASVDNSDNAAMAQDDDANASSDEGSSDTTDNSY